MYCIWELTPISRHSHSTNQAKKSRRIQQEKGKRHWPPDHKQIGDCCGNIKIGHYCGFRSVIAEFGPGTTAAALVSIVECCVTQHNNEVQRSPAASPHNSGRILSTDQS